MIKSAIHYMGTKEKLLPQLLPLFPKDIDTFYDLFGGSGVVTLNVKATKYVLNDLNNHLFNLYKMFNTESFYKIHTYIVSQINKYQFNNEETVKSELAKINKKPFEDARTYINEHPSTLGFYFLTFFSFCNQFRFSQKGIFNMPVGNGHYNKGVENDLKTMCNEFKNKDITFFNQSYDDFNIDTFTSNDFIYCDIPYCNTNAVYNETSRDIGGWTIENDYKFFEWCEKLNRNNIRFAISNCYTNKGKVNNHLKKWVEENQFICHHLNMTYASHGVNNTKTDEVLICNYGEKSSDSIFDL